MHDMVQEMAHYIVRGEHPNNPETHSRVWKCEEIEEMCFGDATMENNKIEAIYGDLSFSKLNSAHISKIVSNMKKLRLLIVSFDMHLGGNAGNAEGVSFLSNELRYIMWSNYPASPFPHNFQPMKLVVLKLSWSMQKELWKGYKHLPQLKVLELMMMVLLSTPDFDGLPRLQKLKLVYCPNLEEIHPSFENHTTLEYLQVSSCKKLPRFPTISHMKNIKALLITWCHLKDGELPSGICGLSNLEELDLSGNQFSRLDFSLLQLTRLQRLVLSSCDELLELPELPSSLSILEAYFCMSLKIVEDFNRNCKQLCQVLLVDGWSDESGKSIKENAINNGCMNLLEGFKIAKGFSPPLLNGSRCRLELPENWSNDFSGFLICIALSDNVYHCDSSISIRMMQRHESGMDSKDDVLWEESDAGGKLFKHTLVWYVPFDSLRQGAWWDQTYKALSFEVNNYKENCSGFGVRLVDKNSIRGLTKTSTNSSSHYTPKIKIEYDSAYDLTVSLRPYS